MWALSTRETESEKDGEPRNQVPEEGFESEEVWHKIFNILNNFFNKLWFNVEKDGEPRNQVPEEGFESEEVWHIISNILLNFLIILSK